MALVSTLTDDFATENGTKWTFVDETSIVDGRLQIVASDSYPALWSATTYSLTGSSGFVELVNRPITGAITYWGFSPANTGAGNEITFRWETGTLYATHRVSGSETVVSSAAFNAGTHRFLRIREASGTTFWDTSPDGASWTNFTSATNPLTVTALYAFIGAGGGAGTSSPAWDNFNTVPTARTGVALASSATGAVATSTAGGTSVAPAYPSLTVSAGQLACYYGFVHVRGAGRTVDTPAGWAALGSYASTNTSSEAAGVGPTRTWLFRRTSTTALTSTQSFTISAQATSGVAQAFIRGYTATGTNVQFAELLAGWSNPTSGTGGGSTAPNGSLAVSAGELVSGDELNVSLGIADDDAGLTASVGSISVTGATIGSAAATAALTSTGNGNDLTTAGFAAQVTAGANTGTTLSIPVTQSPANQMHGLVLRVRATADVGPPGAGTGSGSWTFSGAAAGVAPPWIVTTTTVFSAAASGVSMASATLSPADGDYRCIAFQTSSTVSAAPGGWDLIYSSTPAGLTRYVYGRKFNAATDTTTVTWTFAATAYLAAAYVSLRGYDESDPVDLLSDVPVADTTTTPQAPAVTPGSPGRVLDILFLRRATTGADTFAEPTPPAGMSKVLFARPGASGGYPIYAAQSGIDPGALSARTYTSTSQTETYTPLVLLLRSLSTSRTGAATGAWTTAGAAAGRKAPIGGATGGWTFAGAAAGKRPASGTAAGTLAYSGVAAGAASRQGASTGAWSSTGTAAGRRSPLATGGSTWGFTGSGAAATAHRGASSGAWNFTGSATGDAPANRGSTSGTWGYSGTATGNAPPNHGVAAGTYTWTGTATGAATPKSAASGGWLVAGSATGEAPPNRGTAAGTWASTGTAAAATARRGVASGTWTFSGSGTARTAHAGAAAGVADFTGTAAGKRPASATGAGSWSCAGTATGVTTRSGAAAGTAAWTGFATSGSGRAGIATGATAWTGTAVGQTEHRSAATGGWDYAGSAAGRTDRSGAATGTWATAGSASGSTTSGGTGGGTWAVTGSATGTAPQVDARTGSAVGGWTFTGSATGQTPRLGGGSGTWTTTGAAAGLAARRGNTTGTWMTSGAAAGAAPQVGTRTGAAAGAWAFSGTATGLRGPVGAAAGSWSWTGTALGVGATKAGAASGAWLYAGAAAGFAPTRVSAGPPRLPGTIRAGDPHPPATGIHAGLPDPT